VIELQFETHHGLDIDIDTDVVDDDHGVEVRAHFTEGSLDMTIFLMPDDADKLATALTHAATHARLGDLQHS
jgi:hypothetical protein